ncbi:glycosyltransferase, partial [Akkermansia sp.]
MKILHTIASMASQSGGTTACTRELVQALNDLGCATDILTVEDRAGSPAEEESSFIRAVPNDLCTPLGISMNLRRRLGAWRDYDLYHTNGLWLDVNHATCAQARKTRKPCVASPHGMLYPQALAIKPWRKKLMLALGHRRDLAQADCLHATCREEARHLRELGFANPVAVIPNPVAVPSWIGQIRRSAGERFRAGFLGRFHPIKNLESLIRAWGSLNLRDAELLLIGDGP